MILVIQHIPIEGPETLGDFLKARDFAIQTVDLSRGEKLPADFSALQAVVCLGGPMNVYEEEKYPFLKDENHFIMRALEEKIPFLGICLGAQLLAKACGAKVVKNPVKEVGFSEIRLTGEGKKDPLFAGVVERFNVFQWHEDAFAIPQAGHWLAKSPACGHQAFRIGPTAYGLQFHVEITDKSIKEWTGAYFEKDNPTHAIITRQMLASYAKIREPLAREAEKIYANFVRMIVEHEEAV